MHGPFDIIGDVHGCFEELAELLGTLGYVVAPAGTGASHPGGRRALFVGDLVGRGPAAPAVLRLAMGMVESGSGRCVQGNHDLMLLEALRSPEADELLRAVRAGELRPPHGLAESLDQLAGEPPEFLARVVPFIGGLVSDLVLDGGKLVVAHAGTPADLAKWTAGGAVAVYGHTPVDQPAWANGAICIDTGCVYGGRLTALRYPERELVAVAARQIYWQPAHRRGPSL
jgi:diadenosine tetraphosphatase ApaH/serine/threonine PP2A family protein phosphatase